MHIYIYIYIYICNNYVVDGGWSTWRLGPCSRTCGGGIQNYTRVCDNPKPSCGGNGCRGLRVDTNPCNTHCCPGKVLTKICMHFVNDYHHKF